MEPLVTFFDGGWCLSSATASRGDMVGGVRRRVASWAQAQRFVWEARRWVFKA